MAVLAVVPQQRNGRTREGETEFLDTEIAPAKFGSVRFYEGIGLSALTSDHKAVLAAGRTLLLSFGTSGHTFANIGSGGADSLLDATGAMLAAHKPASDIIVAFQHEPEKHSASGPATDYVAAFRRFSTRIKAKGATNRIAVILEGFTYNTASGNYPPSQYDPGPSYRDIMCADAYNWSEKNNGRWQSFATVYTPFRTWMAANLPTTSMMITEVASDDDPNDATRKAQWIKDMLTELKLSRWSRLEAIYWFNSRDQSAGTPPNGGYWWYFDDSPFGANFAANSLAAFKQIAQDAYWTTVGPPPPPPPPPPPASSWAQVNPHGAGFQNAGAVGPWSGHTNIVLTGGDTAGIHKSADGGDTFANRDASITGIDAHIASIEPHPTQAGRFFALTGNGTAGSLMETTDYGDTWVDRSSGTAAIFGDGALSGNSGASSLLGPGNGEHPRSVGWLIAVDSANGYIYVATFSSGIYRGTLGATSGISSWTRIGLAPGAGTTAYYLRGCVYDSTNDVVYVSSFSDPGSSFTTQSGHVFRITSPHGSPVVTELTGSPLCASAMLLIGDRLYTVAHPITANLASEGLWYLDTAHSAAAGAAWTKIAAVPTAGSERWMSLDGYKTSGVTTLWCGSAGMGTHSLCKVTDASGTWQATIYPTATTTTIDDMGGPNTPADPWWMYTARNGMMLGRSTFVASTIRIDKLNTSHIYVFGRSGAWRSVNGGQSWYPIVKGIGASVCLTVLADPATQGRVYVGLGDWSLLASTDSLATVQNLPPPSGSFAYSTCLDESTSPATIIQAASVRQDQPTIGSKIYRNPNVLGSGAWVDTGFSAPTAIVTGLCCIYNGTTRILLATTSNGQLWRKNGDAGTWTQIAAAAMTPSGGLSLASTDTTPFSRKLGRLEVYIYDRATGVWRSSDHGATWVRIWNHPSSNSDLAGWVVVHPSDKTKLYVSDNTSVYLITNADTAAQDGATVSTIASAIGARGPLAIDPVNLKIGVCDVTATPRWWESPLSPIGWVDKSDQLYQNAVAAPQWASYDRQGAAIIALSGNGVVMQQASSVVNQPPTVAITTPAANQVYALGTPSVTLSGTVTDDAAGSTATYTLDGGSPVALPLTTGSFNVTVPVTGGAHTITVTAQDAGGLTGSASVTFTVTADTVLPSLTVSTPAADATVSNATTSQTVAGTASDDIALSSVTVNGTAVTLGGASGPVTVGTSGVIGATTAPALTIQGARTHLGNAAEGLLITVRAATGIFDDMNATTLPKWRYPGGATYDPSRQTTELCNQLATYKAKGVDATAVSMMGALADPAGSGPPWPWDACAFTTAGARPTSGARAGFWTRLDQLLTALEQQGQVAIIHLLYGSAMNRLTDAAAVNAAMAALVDWCLGRSGRNILFSIGNEVNNSGYTFSVDTDTGHGGVDDGRVGLMNRMRSRLVAGGWANPMVGVSYGSGTTAWPSNAVVAAADWVGLSNNSNTSTDLTNRLTSIRALSNYIAKPIPLAVVEDNSGTQAAAVSHQCGAGLYIEGSSGSFGGGDYLTGLQAVPTPWGLLDGQGGLTGSEEATKKTFFDWAAQYAVTPGAFSTSVPLAVGSNLITVVATDSSGNRRTVTRTITRQANPPPPNTPPVVAISTPTASQVFAAGTTSVTLAGTVTDDAIGSTATFTLDGGSARNLPLTSGTTGNFSQPVTLAAGQHTIVVTATDAGGLTNTQTVAFTVTKDTTPPTLTVTTPAADGTVSNATAQQEVAGTASDNVGVVSVNVNGQNLPLSGGAFDGFVPLAVGSNTLIIQAVDAAGNVRVVNRTITRAGAEAPPFFTNKPVINGQVIGGNTVTCTDATCTGTPTPTVTRKWLLDGADTGQTGTSFAIPATTDDGKVLSVTNHAVNTAGTADATSIPSAAITTPAAPPPVWTVQPSITGQTGTAGQDGDLLTGHDGTFSPGSVSSRKWQKSSTGTSGSEVDIGGATGTTLDTTGMAGVYIRYGPVDAVNSGTHNTAVSPWLGPIASAPSSDSAPQNATPPSLSADATTITVTPGQWTGSPTPQITDQFYHSTDEGVSWVIASGETGLSYSPPSTLSGALFKVAETATNTVDTVTVESGAIQLVNAPGGFDVTVLSEDMQEIILRIRQRSV